KLMHASNKKLFIIIALLLCTVPLRAQLAPQQTPAPPDKPSLSLSPAVIMGRGNFGQGLTQTLTLSNNTGADLAFELVAEDMIVKDGKRVYVPAGELPDSIAASAVFSQKKVLIKAHTAGSVEVHLTIPPKTDIRAVVAIFRGTDVLPTSSGNVGMTASLSALITFNLSDNVKLQPEPARVTPASASANMTISQWLQNAGTEPVLPEGTAAVLNEKGSLVGKATFVEQRLLPGERQQFVAEFPEQLPPGSYRAMCSFEFEGKTQTSSVDFKIP
ncbi:MAG TPA: hypothetical protein VN669_04645, partial [Candidatus Acidoferrales bacterium]|nr:hypothetical protein [Candidatus Acidoferrales bacterium]